MDFEPSLSFWGFHSIAPAREALECEIGLMKFRLMFAIGSAALMAAGCASYEGATADPGHSDYNTGMGPIASPTFRPGMNPYLTEQTLI